MVEIIKQLKPIYSKMQKIANRYWTNEYTWMLNQNQLSMDDFEFIRNLVVKLEKLGLVTSLARPRIKPNQMYFLEIKRK